MNMKLFLKLLALVFITLKLLQQIDWSWWYVIMPLWLPMVVSIVFGGLYIWATIAGGRHRSKDLSSSLRRYSEMLGKNK